MAEAEKSDNFNSDKISTMGELPYKKIEKHFTDFVEASYFNLSSRGSIYTLVPVRSADSTSKILIASLEKVYCLECFGKPALVEIPLTLVPSGSDIVSIDAFQRSSTDEFVLGVTFVKRKKSNEPEENVLNVYWGWEFSSFSSVQQFQVVSQTSSSLPISFMPYQLYNTTLFTTLGKEIVWLLSGSDWALHLYRFSKDNCVKEETDIESFFPELSKLNDITLRINIAHSSNDQRRTTVVGGEAGTVHVFEVDILNREKPFIVSSREILWDYPVSTVSLFTDHIDMIAPSFLSNGTSRICEEKSKSLAMLIATSLEGCYIYSNIFEGNSEQSLPESASKDVVTCALLCDVDFDGRKEVVIGTFGQVIMIYKKSEELDWILSENLTLPSPVLAMAYEDVTGEGICSLIVMTLAGIHIFEHSNEKALSVVIERLQRILALKQ